MIKVAINGFGRIGRLAFRAGIVADDIEIVAINAPDKTPAQLAYTVKYDSVHGRFNGTVEYDDSSITVNGKRVAVVGNRNPAELPWGEMGVEYVLECTGAFLTTEKAQAHLDAGAQVVVLSGPSKDDTPMFVCGAGDISGFVDHICDKGNADIYRNAGAVVYDGNRCLLIVAGLLIYRDLGVSGGEGIDDGVCLGEYVGDRTADGEDEDECKRYDKRRALGRSSGVGAVA